MQKISLGKKLSIVTVVAVILFLGGVLAFQSLAENKVLASEVTEAGYEEEVMSGEDINKLIEDMNKLTVDGFIDYYGYDSQICKKFSSKYDIDSSSVAVGELSSEQYIYLNALITLCENSSNPILARNEEIQDGQVTLNEDGEYMYSLETQLNDVNAISNDIDTTTPIIEIVEKYGLDPDGNIGYLTPEIIIEIDNKLFEISDHPKE